jgi:prepilin-type processing-associated H-X9-DG protein/prepilin-type N-terminal cleavage/methylation domain-containing protein
MSSFTDVRPNHRRSGGFTLVELLAVIGIIALLIAMLLPALSRAREQAKTVQCMAQLRSLGQAFMLYANNNRGQLPVWSGIQNAGDTRVPPDSPGLGWMEQLEPYHAKVDSMVYRCPSFTTDRAYSNYFIAARYSYSVGRSNIKLTDIKLSTMYVLSGDCTTQRFYPAPWGIQVDNPDDVDKDDATQPCLLFRDEAGGRNVHITGNNVLFADGHVTTLPGYDPQYLTFHPKERLSWDQVTLTPLP